MKEKLTKRSIKLKMQRKQLNNALQTITEFFSATTVGAWRRIIRHSLLAACSSHIYSKDHPGNLITYFSLPQKLVVVVDSLNRRGKKEKPPFSKPHGSNADKRRI